MDCVFLKDFKKKQRPSSVTTEKKTIKAWKSPF